MDKFGWCILGTGSITFKVAPELLKNENSYIVSCWNRTHEKAVLFSNKFGGTAYENIDECLKRDDIDCVYVAVTNDVHYKFALKAIEYGKNVLLEKPFTINKKETIDLINKAKENNVYLSEAMWTWYNDTAIKTKENISKIGNIKSAKLTFGFPIISLSKKGRLWDIERGGGALLDLGVYPIRYAYELFGMPKSIEATASLYKGIDKYDEIIFKYDNFVCIIKTCIDRIVSEYVYVKGEKGEIKVPFFHQAHKTILKTEKKQIFKYKGLLYQKQFKVVEDEIKSGLSESNYLTHKSTIDVMELLDKIRNIIGVKYPQD